MAINMVGQVQRLQDRPQDAAQTFARLEEQARQFQQHTDPADGTMVRTADVLEWLATHYQSEIAEQRQSWNQAAQALERLFRKPVEQAPEGLGWSAELQERLARVYWRLGQHDKAAATFEDILTRWPDASRGPLVKLAILYLQNVSTGVEEPKLAYLSCPLGQLGRQADNSSLLNVPGASVASLPEPPNAVRDGVGRVLADVPSESIYRGVLLMESGWMLFEEGRLEKSTETFGELAQMRTGALGKMGAIVRQYGELSRAVVLAKQGENEEALKKTQAVVAAGPKGHVQLLAGSLSAALARESQEKRVDAKCGVQKLQ
jgi:tetratricopeptide (TPR) repeat protein